MFPWSHKNPTLFRRLPIDNAPWPEPLLEIFAGPAATVKLFHKHWPPKTCKHQTFVVLDNVRKSFQTIFHEFPVVRPLLLIGAAQNRTCMLLFVECCIHSIVLVVLDRNHSVWGAVLKLTEVGCKKALVLLMVAHITRRHELCGWARLGPRRESCSRVLALTQNLSPKNPTNISN